MNPPPANAATLLLLLVTACATAHVPVPATLDSGLDPTDDTRLDWGPLGSPRVVDLVALGLVAQHLTAQEGP